MSNINSLNMFKVNGIGLYDAMSSIYLLTDNSNSGASSALSATTISSLNSTKINGDSIYDIFNGLLRSASA
jgi:hypothetical protein